MISNLTKKITTLWVLRWLQQYNYTILFSLFKPTNRYSNISALLPVKLIREIWLGSEIRLSHSIFHLIPEIGEELGSVEHRHSSCLLEVGSLPQCSVAGRIHCQRKLSLHVSLLEVKCHMGVKGEENLRCLREDGIQREIQETKNYRCLCQSSLVKLFLLSGDVQVGNGGKSFLLSLWGNCSVFRS